MRIAIGSDHRGWQVKARLVKMLQGAGHEIFDLGTNSADSVDYPDIASAVSSRVSAGDVERGILICGTGIGMSISANKFSGVRAATCQDAFVAEMSRRHNDVNVLSFFRTSIFKINPLDSSYKGFSTRIKKSKYTYMYW